MNRFLTTAALALAAFTSVAVFTPSSAQAQVTVYYPAPVVTYSVPAPPPPVYYARPAYSYYAPAPVRTYYAPAPVTTYYAPAYVTPSYPTYYTRTKITPRKVKVRYYGPYYAPPAVTYRPAYYGSAYLP